MGGIRRSAWRVLAALAAMLVAASAQQAGAEDIDALRAEAQSVGAEITAMGERLEELGRASRELSEEIVRTDQEVGELELQIAATEDAYEEAEARFEERAVEVYKDGGGAHLEMLLSAETFAQMETVAQAMSESAELDGAVLDDLVAARADAEEAQAALDERKQDLMAAITRKDAIAADIESTIAERDRVLAALNDEIEELARAARIEAREEAAEAAAAATPPESDWPPAGPAPGTPADPTWGTHAPDRLVGTGPSQGVPEMFSSTGVSFEGEASWYGPGFEGNTTANGDIFDSRLYTVASKTLPFETYLYVTYQGRGVVVYVNDRGPYADDRILDLSHAAAQAIGISGVGWVRAEIIVKN